MTTAPPTPNPERTSPAQFEMLMPPPQDGSTRARLGRLTLPHGVVETPQFMPVGTNATGKALDPDDLRAAGLEDLAALARLGLKRQQLHQALEVRRVLG